ncbi:TetR/AcrR family transcriptional regulator [Streptomyces sp. NPDC003442]
MVDQKKRRKSPHDGEATRETLMDAAEKLFAEQGVEAVSIRAVNSTAGLAPAAVHYHFGSKEALLTAVLERRGRSVVADIAERCDQLLAQEGQPNARDVMETVVAPYLALLERDHIGGGRWLAITGQLILSGSREMEALSAPATERLQTLVRRAFPDTRPDDLENTWRLAVEAVVLLLARAPGDEPEADEPEADGPQELGGREALIDFATGGLVHALRGATERRVRTSSR